MRQPGSVMGAQRCRVRGFRADRAASAADEPAAHPGKPGRLETAGPGTSAHHCLSNETNANTVPAQVASTAQGGKRAREICASCGCPPCSHPVRPPGRSYAPRRVAKTTLFAAGNGADVRKKRCKRLFPNEIE